MAKRRWYIVNVLEHSEQFSAPLWKATKDYDEARVYVRHGTRTLPDGTTLVPELITVEEVSA